MQCRRVASFSRVRLNAASTAAPPVHTDKWARPGHDVLSPGRNAAINAGEIAWVPLGKNNALSKRSARATTRWQLVDGRVVAVHIVTHRAAAMAARMPAEGWVTVSLRRSIDGVGLEIKARAPLKRQRRESVSDENGAPPPAVPVSANCAATLFAPTVSAIG